MATNLDKTIRASFWSILGSFMLAIIKGLAFFFGSLFALIADALESVADALSSTLVLLGFKYLKCPADENHTYGHGKIEPIITFLMVLLIIFSALFIGYQSIVNINTSHQLLESWTLIVVVGIKDTEKCVVRKARMDFNVELHLIVEGSFSVRDGHTIGQVLKMP